MTDLPLLVGTRRPVPGRFLLEGARFGLDQRTLILGERHPGVGAPLHRHVYEELVIVHGG